jgi:hypothetical protein
MRAASQLREGRADERDRRLAMSLQALALGGLIAAVVLIVVAVTLINKFAN